MYHLAHIGAVLVAMGFIVFEADRAWPQVVDLEAPPRVLTVSDQPVLLSEATFDAPRLIGDLSPEQSIRISADRGTVSLSAGVGYAVLDGEAQASPWVTITGPGTSEALDGLSVEPPPGFAGGYTLSVEVLGPLARRVRVPVIVHRPIDAEATRTMLLDGAETLPTGPRAIGLIPYGPTAVAIAHANGEPASEPIVAAASWGAGRVVALSDGRGLDPEALMDGVTAAITHNALAWLADDALADAPIVTPDGALAGWLSEAGYAAVAIVDPGQPEALGRALESAAILIMPALDQAPEATLDAIGDFTRAGGGLLIAGGGDWAHGPGDPLWDAPLNRLLREPGLAFAPGIGPPPAAQRLDRAGGGLDLDDVLAALGDAMGNGRTWDEVAPFISDMSAILPLDDPLALTFDDSLMRAIERIRPSPERPVRAPWQKALLLHEAERLFALPPEQTPAHRSAEALYGAPRGRGVERLVTIEVEPGQSRWQSTGQYALPGRVIRLESPPEAVGRGWTVRIGGHTESLPIEVDWHRPPRVHVSAPLDAIDTRVSSPFGGAIYIDVGPDPYDGPSIELALHGSVRQPRFVLGSTNAGLWQGVYRDDPAPYAELVAPRIIVSLPSDAIRELDSPAPILNQWDLMIATYDAFIGQSDRRSHPERINIDVQVLGGDRRTGYPMQGDRSTIDALLAIDESGEHGVWSWWVTAAREVLARPDDAWREGSPFDFDGQLEALAEVMATRAHEARRLALPEARAWASSAAGSMQAVIDALARPGATFATMDPNGRAAMLMLLGDRLGWGAFEAAIQRYRDIEPMATVQQRRDRWLLEASAAFEVDLGRYLGAVGGMPLTAAARASVADWPDWLPIVGQVARRQIVAPGRPVTVDLGAGALTLDGVVELAPVGFPEHGWIELADPGRLTYTSAPGFVGTERLGYTLRSSAGTTWSERLWIEVRSDGANVSLWPGLAEPSLAALRGAPGFPDQPAVARWVSGLDARVERDAPVGARLRGRIVPPETGLYRLAVSASGPAELWLSDDAGPAALQLRAQADRLEAAPPLGADPRAITPPLRLERGMPYLVEARAALPAGPGHITVGLSRAGGPFEALPDIDARVWRMENAAPIAADDAASVPPGEASPLAPLVNDSDPEGDRLALTRAVAERGVAAIEGDAIVYTPPAGFEGDARIEYEISDGQGGLASAHIDVRVLESLAVTPVAPIDAVVLDCIDFAWRPIVEGGPSSYYIVLQRDGDAPLDPMVVRDAGRDLVQFNACRWLDDGMYTWWIVAFDEPDFEGRSVRTRGGRFRVDMSPPTIDAATIIAPVDRCSAGVLRFSWPPAVDDGIGLAESPYTLTIIDSFGRVRWSSGQTAERAVVSPPLGDGVFWWILEIRDAFGNWDEVATRFEVDCTPPAIADRWSGVLGGRATPFDPVATERLADDGLRIHARGRLCHTPNPNCHPAPDDALCTDPAGTEVGEDGPQVGALGLPFGALLAGGQRDGAEPIRWVHALDERLDVEGHLHLAVNVWAPSSCRLPGYAVNALFGPGTGQVWPADGEVLDHDQPALVFLTPLANGERDIVEVTLVLDGEPIEMDAEHVVHGYTVEEPLDDGVYTWSVQVVDRHGNAARTAPSSFVVDRTAPRPFEITRETHWVRDGPVELCWAPAEDSSGIDHYRVALSTDDEGDWPVIIADEPAAAELCATLEISLEGGCAAIEAVDRAGWSTRVVHCIDPPSQRPEPADPEEMPPDGMPPDGMPPDGMPPDPDPPMMPGSMEPGSIEPDAEMSDAGMSDAGMSGAGVSDAGQPADRPGGSDPTGCAASGPAPSNETPRGWVWLALAALIGGRARRR